MVRDRLVIQECTPTISFRKALHLAPLVDSHATSKGHNEPVMDCKQRRIAQVDVLSEALR